MMIDLPFSAADFFQLQCDFGHTEVKPGIGIVAIVLKVGESVVGDGRQTAMLKIASKDGGFEVVAYTMTGNSDRLRPNDIVIWVPSTYSTEMAQTMADAVDDPDLRFAWVGAIAYKIRPEINASDPKFKVISNYT